jgi:dipeptidyl aminopeptidase/acylaminoacyl peptidase
MQRKLLSALALCLAFTANAQTNSPANAASAAILAPNANLKADGIPPIPQALADRISAYNDFRGYGLADWHPTERTMLVRHRESGANTAQYYLLREPQGKPEKLTDFPDPPTAASFDRIDGKFVIYNRDAGGNEATQVFRLDLDSRASTALSSPDERSSYSWNYRGDKILIKGVPLDRTAAGGKREQVGVSLTYLDPRDPAGKRSLGTLPGPGWDNMSFSPDDKTIALVDYRTNADTSVWLIDVASGERKQILPRPGAPKAGYFGFEWSRDGKRLFLTTNESGEFLQLASYTLASGALNILSGHIPWDVDDIALSPDGKRLLAAVNANGRTELRLFDADTNAELPRPNVPVAALGALTWHRSRPGQVAFALNSPQSPGDVYSLNLNDGALTRWTTAYSPPGVEPDKFATPQLVQWKSFDGRVISAWLHAPDPAKFPGKRPVLLSFHGGPEGQARVGFVGRWNYLVNELGYAMLDPNVRGSTGYGKSFQNLDDGFLREDSVKDGGAALDWIATQPNLDASRVVVFGGSYGGYMSLAMATHYSDRLRGAVDIVGISNFVSFLQNTESYRRDLRRVEYGDERDPAMRAFLEKISPLNNAQKIRVPMFVVHGKNDPRVPVGEAEQIVAKIRENKVPVWYLLADNEGHGFARKNNADYMFYSVVKFLENALLNP